MNPAEQKKAINYSKSIHLSLKIGPDENSTIYMNVFNTSKIFSQHNLFSMTSINPKTSINENFIVFISMLKNRTYQIYKINKKKSGILKNIAHRKESGDFIGNGQFVKIDKIWENYFLTLMENSEWLSEYARELLGFDKFDQEDFASIIESASPLLLGVHWSEYVKSNESFKMIHNIHLTNERIHLIFGSVLAELITQFDRNFSQLNLTEYELGMCSILCVIVFFLIYFHFNIINK